LVRVDPPTDDDFLELGENEDPVTTLVLNRPLNKYERRALPNVLPDAEPKPDLLYTGDSFALTVRLSPEALRDQGAELPARIGEIARSAASLQAKHRQLVADYQAAAEALNQELDW
jgi:hypothetical protein